MSQPTVVSLQPKKQRKAVLPPIVHSVRQQAKVRLLERLQKLFDSTDDALFELADRSQTDVDQNLFFQSMRQIRLQRKPAITRFMQEVYQDLNDLFLPEVPAADDGEEGPVTEPEELTLVGEEELEMSVATSNIVTKVNDQYAVLLQALTQRIDAVCKSQTISDNRNPFSPARLSRAFVACTDELQVDIKIKIILLKLFERMVMLQLETMYVELNQLMIEAGILPDLGDKAPAAAGHPLGMALNQAGPGVIGDPQHGVPAGPAGAEPGMANQVPVHHPGQPPAQQMVPGTVPHMPTGQQAWSGQPQQPQAPTHYGTPQVPGMATHGMSTRGVAAEFGLLQQLLAGARPNLPAAPVASRRHNPAEIIPQTGIPDGLGGWKEREPQAAPEPEITHSDISLSTEQLLTLLTAVQQDSSAMPLNIAEEPVHVDVRSVIQSKSETESGETPHMEQNDEDAISVVGMLFDYILNDKNLAIPMKALISRLQIPVVKLAVADKEFFASTEHPARLLLNELSTAGIGWSSAQELRRDALYDKIEAIVQDILSGPCELASLYEQHLDDLHEFLQKDTKRHALVEQRVLEAEAGKARTRQAKEAVQKLINQKASGLRLPPATSRFVGDVWSKTLVFVASRHGQESSEWVQKVQTLDDLLWCLQPLHTKDDMERRRTIVPDLLQFLNKGMSSTVHNKPERDKVLDSIREEIDQAIAHDEAYLEDEEVWSAPDVPETYKELADIKLSEPIPEPTALPKVAPKHLAMVDGLHIGGWVEIRTKDTDPLRCKLSTVVQPGDRYVFVNRRGMKVAEHSKVELGALLQLENMSLLDDSEVFDRALQAVVGNLRKMQDKPAQID